MPQHSFNTRLGLDPASLENIAAQLLALEGHLQTQNEALQNAASQAFNPLQYAFVPGSLLVAPASITGLLSAANLTEAAVSNLNSLTTSLHAKAAEQTKISNPKALSQNPLLRPKRIQLPNVNTDPHVVHKWWQNLPVAHQETLLKDHAEKLGNLDGIPGAARDRANRQKLLESLQGERVPAFAKESLLTIWRDLIDTENRHPETDVQLLLLEETQGGQFHTAIAIGDPDTANFLTTVSFGIHTTVASLADNIKGVSEQFNDVTRLNESLGRKTSLSIIAWQGYDSGTVFTVHDDEKAAAGAVKFTSFSAGLEANNPTALRVDMAHSYGTRMLADAYLGGATATAAIFIGSPGVSRGVNKAAQLTPQIFTARAKNDLVAGAIYQGSSGAQRPESHSWQAPSPDPHAKAWGATKLPVTTSLNAGLGHTFFVPEGKGYMNDQHFLRANSHIILKLEQ